MLTFNKQHLKLAFGNALKNRVAADFLFHITVHSEKKKGRSRTPLFMLSDTNVIGETILLVFKLV